MLINILKNTVEKYPQKTAIVYDKSRISYEDLYSDVSGLSNGLLSLGIKQNACVALILPNCPEFITSFYAIAKNNSIALLVNPALAEDEIKYYVDDSEAVAIITDSQHADVCRNIVSNSDRDCHIILIDAPDSNDIRMSDLMRDKTVNDTDRETYKGIAVYQYSSGSTGRPKRVGKTSENLYHEANNFHLTLNTNSIDNFLCVVPFFHAHGLGNCLLASSIVGGTLTILEPLMKNGVPVNVPFVLRRDRVLELVKEERITILPGVPFIYSALADTPNDFEADISSLRICFSAGNFLSKEIFDKFMARFGIPVRQLYGCTEVGSFSINLDTGGNVHYDSVGQPMKNNEVKIVDENGNTMPPGMPGEISIKSKSLTSGYLNMPELNKESFNNGFFLTGDLGKIDEESRLFITGRKKIFIEVGGNKVDPLEIEDVLVTHPNVKEVVVVGVEGPFGGEMIKAVIVPDGDCQERDIVSYCRNKIASFKIPQVFEFRKEIPKSPLGKILRKNLV